MPSDTAGALALSVGLIGFAAMMRRLTGTWLHPGAFFALWWCFAGILPLVLAPYEHVGPNAIAWLIAACIAVAAGSIIGNGGLKTRIARVESPPTDRELTVFGWALAVAIVLGIGSSVTFALAFGVSLRSLLDVQQLVVISNQFYFQRYADGGAITPPALSRALLPFVYLAPALGGVLFALRRKVLWRLFSILSFLPAIVVTVLQTTKAAFLFGFVLWLSGYFAVRLRLGKTAVFTRQHVIVTTVAGGVVAVFFFAVTLARLASTDVSLANVVLLKLASSAFGHMTVFSQWLTEYWAAPFSPSLGAVTFAGPLEMLGYSQRIPGLFENVIELVAGDNSNVYTGFRPLIQDFTIPGALAVLVLLGFVGGVGFRLVAAGKWSAVALLMIPYVTVMWSPVTWFWIYNSLTFTVVAVALVVWFIRVWRGSSRAVHRERLVGTS